MPNQGDRHCSRFDVWRTKVNAVARVRPILCLLSEYQNDPMPLKPSKRPTMSRTIPDHGFRWPDLAIEFSNRMHVASVRFYSIIYSLLWRVELALWCPNVNRFQFGMFGPRIPCNLLPSNPTNRKFGSHCVWHSHRLNIHLLRMRLHRLFGTCCQIKYARVKNDLGSVRFCAFASLTINYNYPWWWRIDWNSSLCDSIARLKGPEVHRFPNKTIHNLDSNHRSFHVRRIHHSSTKLLELQISRQLYFKFVVVKLKTKMGIYLKSVRHKSLCDFYSIHHVSVHNTVPENRSYIRQSLVQDTAVMPQSTSATFARNPCFVFFFKQISANQIWIKMQINWYQLRNENDIEQTNGNKKRRTDKYRTWASIGRNRIIEHWTPVGNKEMLILVRLFIYYQFSVRREFKFSPLSWCSCFDFTNDLALGVVDAPEIFEFRQFKLIDGQFYCAYRLLIWVDCFCAATPSDTAVHTQQTHTNTHTELPGAEF